MVLEEHILCIWAKTCLREKRKREARVLEEEGDCGVILPFVQDFARRKKEKG